MSNFDWKGFLEQWSQEILNSLDSDDLSNLPPEVVESGWLGDSGATEAEIIHAETRLQTSFPPSYREFLKVTNGWYHTTAFIHKLWSTEKIEWFSIRHQNWIGGLTKQYGQSRDLKHLDDNSQASLTFPTLSDEEYLIYGEQQDSSKLRMEYLQTALEISQKGDSCIYLLNPQIVTQEGEWEAWFFGDWLPGADRYRSFLEMMQAEYENFLEQKESSDKIENSQSDIEQQVNLAESAKIPPEHSDHSVKIPESKINSIHQEVEESELSELENQKGVLAVPKIEIIEFLLCQPTETKIPQFINLNRLPLPNLILKRHQSVTLEIALKVTNLDAVDRLQQQALSYQFQCFARDLTSHQSIFLGNFRPLLFVPEKFSTIIPIPEITSHKGIYSLQLFVTLEETTSGKPLVDFYQEIPRIQVI